MPLGAPSVTTLELGPNSAAGGARVAGADRDRAGIDRGAAGECVLAAQGHRARAGFDQPGVGVGRVVQDGSGDIQVVAAAGAGDADIEHGSTGFGEGNAGGADGGCGVCARGDRDAGVETPTAEAGVGGAAGERAAGEREGAEVIGEAAAGGQRATGIDRNRGNAGRDTGRSDKRVVVGYCRDRPPVVDRQAGACPDRAATTGVVVGGKIERVRRAGGRTDDRGRTGVRLVLGKRWCRRRRRNIPRSPIRNR